MSINKNNLYELPWQMNDCPDGWIEPTTFCNLKCPLCYRGCDRSDHQPEHRRLADMKQEVDSFIKERNVQAISIAGGEPLLYPDLNELIGYIKSKKLNILLITNGVLLDEKKLAELKELKVDTVFLHIDNYQNRDDIRTVAEMNLLRDRYCEMFRRVGGVDLGFVMPMSKDNLNDLPEILDFYKNNSDIISLVDFTTMNDVFSYEHSGYQNRTNIEELSQKLKENYDIEYSAYLSKAVTSDIAWLWGAAVFSGKNYLGSMDKELIKIIQEGYHQKNGRYLFVGMDIKDLPLAAIIKIIGNRSFRKIFLNYLSLKNKARIHCQLLLIVDSPLVVDGKINICKNCPNLMYFNKKLVPSCCYSRIADSSDEYAKTLKYYSEDYI